MRAPTQEAAIICMAVCLQSKHRVGGEAVLTAALLAPIAVLQKNYAVD